MSTTKPISADVKGEPSGEFTSNLGRAIFQQKIESVLLSTKLATKADGVAISLRDGTAYVCRASVGVAPEIGVRVEPGEGICGRCIAESKAIVEQDLDGAIKSVAAVPVMREGETYGFVAGFSMKPNAFPQSVVDDFHRLAQLIHSQVEPIVPMSLNPEAQEANDDLLAQLGIVPDEKPKAANSEEEDDSFLTELVRDVLQDAPSNQAIVAPQAHTESEPKPNAAPAFPTRTTEEVLMQVVEHKPPKPAGKSKSGAASAPAPAPEPVPKATKTETPSTLPPPIVRSSSSASVAAEPAATTETELQIAAEGESWTWRRIAVVAALLLLVVAGIWYYVRRQKTVAPEPQKVVATAPAPVPEAANPAGTAAAALDTSAAQPTKPAEPTSTPEKKPAARQPQPIMVASGNGPSRPKPAGEDASPSLTGVPVKLSAPVLPSASTDVVFGGTRSSGAIPAKLFQRFEPAYPTMARSMHVSGTVRMDVTVGTDGRVKSVRRIEGNEMLANSAEAAVRRWRYLPARQNGNPVESIVEVIFNFK